MAAAELYERSCAMFGRLREELRITADHMDNMHHVEKLPTGEQQQLKTALDKLGTQLQEQSRAEGDADGPGSFRQVLSPSGTGPAAKRCGLETDDERIGKRVERVEAKSPPRPRTRQTDTRLPGIARGIRIDHELGEPGIRGFGAGRQSGEPAGQIRGSQRQCGQFFGVASDVHCPPDWSTTAPTSPPRRIHRRSGCSLLPTLPS